MKPKQTLTLLLCMAITAATHAQVTIGSNHKPNAGALLDLKTGSDGKSTQGLAMPRVQLTTKDKLHPMLESGYNTSEDALHTGLAVYNTNECPPFGKGIFVWTGAAWTAISQTQPLGAPLLSGIPDTLHIPSGMDARTSAAQTATFTLGNANEAAWTTPVVTYGYGLTFTSPREITPATQTWNTFPATLSVWPDDMTSAQVTASNPWQTRESKMTVTSTNKCGETTTKDIVLNQTNYQMNAVRSGVSTVQITINNASTQIFNVRSNVAWKATVIPAAGSVLSDILSDYTSTIKGTPNSLGANNYETFSYTGSLGGAGTKGQVSTLVLEDVHHRAKDVVISIIQCNGTSNDISSVTMSATPAETATGSSAWGTNVVRHQAKAGVYAEFYSADFGDAGRWMVTNLAATNYDGVTHPYRTLTGPTAYNEENPTPDKAYWGYPSLTSPTTTTEYNANPNIGYLYSWDAATAGKGGSDGLQQGIAYDEGGKDHTRIQGICPAGWHLPDDKEWTDLENEVIKNTTKYANVEESIDTGDGTQLMSYTTSGLRGVHGIAFKDPCEPYNSASYQGVSKSVVEGGFYAPYPGYAYETTSLVQASNRFKENTSWWASSSYGPTQAYIRMVALSTEKMRRGAYLRAFMYSVRCKKN